MKKSDAENTYWISWISRHPPLEAQRRDLQRLFPRSILHMDSNPFGDADDIVRRVTALGAEEVVIVAPLSLVAKLIDRGIRPLWPQMEPCTAEFARSNPDVAVSAPRGRWFAFTKFQRLVALEMKFEEITNG